MRLRIVTPLSVVVDESDVVALRAEDATGSFGVLPRHADFLTSLVVGVVGWRRKDGSRSFCAVRRGMFSVTGGEEIAVTTREAVQGDDLATLHETVLSRFQAAYDEEKVQHVEATRLHLNAIRQIMNQLRADGRGLIG